MGVARPACAGNDHRFSAHLASKSLQLLVPCWHVGRGTNCNAVKSLAWHSRDVLVLGETYLDWFFACIRFSPDDVSRGNSPHRTPHSSASRRLWTSLSSMLMNMTPLLASRSRQSRRGYIILSQAEWYRPPASYLLPALPHLVGLPSSRSTRRGAVESHPCTRSPCRCCTAGRCRSS